MRNKSRLERSELLSTASQPPLDPRKEVTTHKVITGLSVWNGLE